MAKIRALNDELQRTAIEELNEVPERIPADLQAIKEWIAEQPHLRARTDDQFLMTFLRGCKYDLELVKSKLDKYFTLRGKYPEMLCCLDADEPKVRELLQKGTFSFLPTPLHDNGPRIAVMRMGVYTPAQYDITAVYRYLNALVEIAMLEDDYAVVNGMIFIIDCENGTAAHLFQSAPHLGSRCNAFSNEALPLCLQAAHLLHTPRGLEPIFNTMKPMMPKKVQEHFFMHGNKLESLYQEIPQKYLPKEYGGENGSIAEIVVDWNEKINKYRQHFKDNANYGTDEHLRLGKPIDFEGLYGVEGAFSKLEVD